MRVNCKVRAILAALVFVSSFGMLLFSRAASASDEILEVCPEICITCYRADGSKNRRCLEEPECIEGTLKQLQKHVDEFMVIVMTYLDVYFSELPEGNHCYVTVNVPGLFGRQAKVP